MAMGFSSTQTTPFRPFWPSCFLIYRSGALSNSVGYSSLSFLTSSRTLRRSEVFKIKRADITSPNITLFNDLFRCQQSSLFNSHSQVDAYKFNDNGRIFLSNEHEWSRATLQIQKERLDKSRNGVKNVKGRPVDTEDCSDHMKLNYDESNQISNDLASSGGFYSNSFACSDQTSTLTNRSQYESSIVEHIMCEKSDPVTVMGTRFDDDRKPSIMSTPRIHIKRKDYMQSNGARRNESASSSTTYDTRTPVNSGNNNAMLKKLNGRPVIGSRKLGAYETLSVEKDAQSSSQYNLLEDDKLSAKFIEAADVLKWNIANENISEITTTFKDNAKITNPVGDGKIDIQERLNSIYDKVLVVNSLSRAKEVVLMLTNQYRHLVHACDTEVAKIDVKQETPVDHGEITCLSIYSGPEADFGNGKSCIWVDILDGGGTELLLQFAPFFEDSSIKKIWHNYSFDNHVIENYGIKLSGFHADTMHMARLWDSSRRANGGYSLEALSSDQRVMSGAQLCREKELFGKVSMKTIFGKKKTKKDGSEGKIVVIAPVEELQREERKSWVCYSALDAICTLKLYESLRNQLSCMAWEVDGNRIFRKSMFDFYEKYWRPFGELLVKMEMEGMLVDRAYLAEIEKLAKAEQVVAANRFRNWASRYCPDAKYMNVGSDAQVRQLLFGGAANSKDPNEFVQCEKSFKVPNTEKVIREGKKTPTKFRNITLTSIKVPLPTEIYTPTGWPSVSGDALKILAGKISAQFNFVDDAFENDEEIENAEAISHKVSVDETSTSPECVDSDYGTAFAAFRVKEEGREACHAIAALCGVCSIDSLISNFILPLQGSNICGKNGRIHCSLNINTETGRLSARKPNLQNQPALEKDRYKIRQAFISAPGNSLIVADYGQLELRILAHLANCKSMLDAFKAGGDFHSRTAMNMYPHIREAVDKGKVLLEWDPQPGEDKPPVPLLKDAFASERRKAKMLNFSIAYGKTPVGLARDWKVSVEEAKETVDLWYRERREVRTWQEARKKEALRNGCVHTLLGRARQFPSLELATRAQKGHIERAAINTPVQGSAADVAMCAMLEISRNLRLRELGWKLLLQVHDEMILEGPSESREVAKAIVVECMSKPFNGENFLKVDLAVDAKCAQNWYAAK